MCKIKGDNQVLSKTLAKIYRENETIDKIDAAQRQNKFYSNASHLIDVFGKFYKR